MFKFRPVRRKGVNILLTVKLLCDKNFSALRAKKPVGDESRDQADIEFWQVWRTRKDEA